MSLISLSLEQRHIFCSLGVFSCHNSFFKINSSCDETYFIKLVASVLLSVAQGEVITDYQNAEAKERMRKLHFGHPFDINDGEFEEHHPKLSTEDDIVEIIFTCFQMKQD